MEAGQQSAHRAGRMLWGAFFVSFIGVLAVALGLLTFTPKARAGGTKGAVELLAALNGAEVLPDSVMAKESAGGVGAPSAAGVHVPVHVPKVRLWDDFGSTLPAQIGNTTITVSGGSQP